MDETPRFPPPPEPGQGWAPPPGAPGSPGGPPAGPPGWSEPPGWGPPPGWEPAPRGFYPLDFGRIFELTFSMFRFHWRIFLGIALIFQLLVTLPGLAVWLFPTPDPNWIYEFYALPSSEVVGRFADYVIPIFALTIVISLITALIGMVGGGTMVEATRQTYVGTPATGRGSIKRALSRWRSLLGVFLITFLVQLVIFIIGMLALVLVAVLLTVVTGASGLVGFLVLVGFVSVIAAWIFVVARWSMAVQAVMVEGLGAMAALGRSWRLVAGSGWRVIGYGIALGLLVLAIAAVLGAILGLVFNPYQMAGFRIVGVDTVRLAIVSVGSGLLGALLTPFPAIAWTLLYLDLRARRGDPINPPGQGAIVASVAEQ